MFKNQQGKSHKSPRLFTNLLKQILLEVLRFLVKNGDCCTTLLEFFSRNVGKRRRRLLWLFCAILGETLLHNPSNSINS